MAIQVETVRYSSDHLLSFLPERSVSKINLFYVGRLPQKTEVVFPVERFVTYEPSDAAWAVPLGIAKVEPRDIERGDIVDFDMLGMGKATTKRYFVSDISIDDLCQPSVTFNVELTEVVAAF